ncbi:MAG: hypothetical protein ABFQ53_01145 [Patescibacteria group bacterium]
MVILFLVDLLTFFYYPETIIAEIFLATREQTPLTWLSALSMFFIALSSFAIYHRTKKKIWYFLAITFFFFSMDDAVYFHERVSGFLYDNTELFGAFPTYIWIVIYSPLLLFSLGALIYLLWRDSTKQTKRLVIFAIIGLGLAILLDMLDGLVQKDDELVLCLDVFCNTAALHLIRLVEEVLEVVTLGMLGYVSIREHCLK